VGEGELDSGYTESRLCPWASTLDVELNTHLSLDAVCTSSHGMKTESSAALMH